MMTTSQLIERLQKVEAEFGSIPVLGGYISDDSSINNVLVLDKHSVNVDWGGDRKNIAGVFLE